MIYDSTPVALAAARRDALLAEADAARLVREARAARRADSAAARPSLLHGLLGRRPAAEGVPAAARAAGVPAQRPAAAVVSVGSGAEGTATGARAGRSACAAAQVPAPTREPAGTASTC